LDLSGGTLSPPVPTNTKIALDIGRGFLESHPLLRMKSIYLEPARQQIPNPELLVNVVSRRVRQLTQGHRPLTQINPKMDFADIALKEISEGKIGYELGENPAGLEAETKPD
jgi:DNA-directed RNA polymerase subunit omega